MKIPPEALQSKGIVYVEKYPYNELNRKSKNGKRHYQTPDGRLVPSVTTVLSATKDMTHLIAWRKRIGEQKAQQITTESANIGTVMHSSLEKHVKGIERKPGSNLIHQKAHQMANIIIDNGLTDVSEVWGSEVSLHYPELYAGATDLGGVYKGAPAIMDFKQTNKPKKEEWVEDYYLQLTAYALAHNELYGTEIKEGHVFMCSRDLQYQQFDLLPEDFAKWESKWWDRVYEYYDKYA